MSIKSTIGISLVVALVVATGFSLFGIGRVIERTVVEKVGVTPGTEHLNDEVFRNAVWLTGSSTLGIGTTTREILASNQGFLILDAQDATPTIAGFATSTQVGATNADGRNTSFCIQFNSATNTAQNYRLYVGAGDGSNSGLGSAGLIFEGGTCQ